MTVARPDTTRRGPGDYTGPLDTANMTESNPETDETVIDVPVEQPTMDPGHLSFTPETGWNALYLDGEWHPAGGRESYPMTDPATRSEMGSTPIGTAADVETAYEAAAAAQPAWASRTPTDRARLLEAVRETLNSWAGELQPLFARECGGVPAKAGFEIELATEMLRRSEGLALQVSGEHKQSVVEQKHTEVHREPVGVVGVISPWNFPLYLSLRAVAPAVATGNTVVLKPAEDTPLLGGLVLARAFEEAGVPDGVLSVIPGDGDRTGDAVASHPTPRVLSFTGSSEVGRSVGQKAVAEFTYPSLELGGNNPHIVTAAADLDWAVDAGVFGSFTHQGQECISINRHVVHESHAETYANRVADRARSLPVGDPKAEQTVVGPVQTEAQRDKIVSLIEKSVAAGATVLAGGSTDGLFVEPTVLTDVTSEMPIAREEHFGPVAPVIEYTTETEAIKIANETRYGLSGSVHSTDLAQARRIAEAMETGMVHINDQPLNDHANTPFGGVGASGLGRYNDEAAIRQFTETKWLSVQREPREYPY